MLKKIIPILILLLGCNEPIVPPNAHDASFCPDAQEVLLRLQCKDSRGRFLGGANKSGEEYEAVCQRNIQNNVAMYAECTSKITNCDGVSKCFQR